MWVRVRLLGSLRQSGAPKEVNFEVPEDTRISTLIIRIIDEYPSLAGVLDGVENLVMFGGVEIGVLEGLDTILGEGSEVVFVPVTHGGR